VNREHWQRLKAILDEVLRLEGAARELCAQRFCEQNPELADELRSLLRAADATVGPTQHITLGLQVAGLAVVGGSADLPERIGPYRIISKLGEGGMGVVYEAAQTSPRRKVAVKIVRGGQFVDEQRARLLQREADTLARLKHPGIGAIFEAGRTEQGLHFFAMELVQGEPLDGFLGRRPKVVDEAELRFRLSLFRKIADAVHYAHQRAVVHRDLKPSNIFVTEETSRDDDAASGATRPGVRLPEIKILDFGLARITDGDVAAATMTTEVGLIKGTLPYMSPEQARGDPDEIDVRCDVYALGVILYEMLSGRRPYDVTRKSLPEALRVICEQPPTALRQSWSGARRIDPDVETIVGRALEKDAGRRYSSAAALSEDVARYLTSQPILARPPSATYQLRKFAARNRAIVGGVAATFLVLVGGVVVASTLGLREAAQRKAAEAARNDLQAVVGFQSAMLRKVDPREMGRGLQQDLTTRIAGLVGQSERATLERSFRNINMTDAALRILDENILARAATSIENDFGDQPLIKAQLYLSLGDTYRALGLLEQAERYVTRAVEIREAESGPEDLQTLWARLTLAVVLERQGRLAESEALSRDVLGVAQRTVGEEHDLTLQSKNRLAVASDRLNKFDEAQALYQSVYDVWRRKLGDDDPRTIWLLHNLGTVRRLAGRPFEGEPMLVEAVAAFERTLGPDHHDTLWAKASLALTYHAEGRLEDAERLAGETLEKRRRGLGDDHQETIETLGLLGVVYLDQGRLEEAEPVLRDALERSRRIVGQDHRETLWTMISLGRTWVRQGRYAEALPLFEEALDGRRRMLGDDDPWTADARRELVELYEKLDRHEDAEALRSGGRR
jgi:non-specific serine/threonine protein kinase/serine/threonine-protein kinase